MQRVLDEYGGFEQMKTSTKDVIIENFERPSRRRRAHLRGSGGSHFVVVSAVPRDFYFGSTVNTIGGTIGGGVGLLLLACVLIVYIMREQQKLVDGSRQSVEIAQEVARNLVLYNTDEAATFPSASRAAHDLRLRFSARRRSDADGNEQQEAMRTEETNYANQDLVLALKQINENLMLYKPHLPEYVLPQTLLQNDEKKKAEALEEEQLRNRRNNNGVSFKYKSMKSVDEEMLEMQASGGSDIIGSEDSASNDSRRNSPKHAVDDNEGSAINMANANKSSNNHNHNHNNKQQ